MADFTAAQYAIDGVLAGINRDQISGIPPAQAASFSVRGGDKKATISWSLSKDVVMSGIVLCTTKGIMIRRSDQKMPDSITDGELVVKRDGLTGSLEVTGLTNKKTYYFKAFPYSDHGVYDMTTPGVTVTPQEYNLLGFKIKKSEADPYARVTYTEMAAGLKPATVNQNTGAYDLGDFGSYWFVTDNKPCMLKNDGTVDYYLNPHDYTKKEGGGNSDVANVNYAGNAMAQFPTVYIKSWEDATYEYVNICDKAIDSSYKAYAHTRNDGSIAPYVYMSLFEGYLASGKIRSLKGFAPMNSQTGTNELTYAKANGAGWSTRSWSHRNLVNMLCTLIFKTTNLQKAVGAGYHTGASSAANLLKTGGASDKGQFYGKSENGNYVKAFHIENHWGNLWERIEGCVTNASSRILIKPAPPYNTTGSGYTDTGITPTGTLGGYINTCKMADYGLIPKTASGSDSTYLADGLWWAANCYALTGGSAYYGLLAGPFALYVGNSVSNASWNVGACLSCEQPA